MLLILLTKRTISQYCELLEMILQYLTRVYQVVEQQPSFPGRREELFKYLAYNVKYPIDAAKNKIEGRVLVTFVVEHDGSISNVNVTNSVYPSLDKGL